jgi:DNA-binding transcriptional MerR regulator
MDREGLVSVSEAARIAGVTARTIRRWASAGLLPYEPSERGRLVDADTARTLAADSNHVRADAERTIRRRSAGRRTDNDRADSGSSADNGHDPPALLATLAQLAERTRKVDELEQERAELYGRLGFYQARVADLEQRLLLTEGAPAPVEPVAVASPAPPQRPWWRFWVRA